MKLTYRSCALALCALAAVLIPVWSLAGAKTKQYYAYQLKQKTVCKHTGITGPTGAVTIYIFALKGKTPTKSELSCSRGEAVVKAGKNDIYAKLPKSYGKTVTVDGTKYQLESFIFIGGSGPAPGFVDKNSIVAASYPSGR